METSADIAARSAAGHRHPYLARAILFGAVWAAFFAFGVYLRTLMPWDRLADLHGLDYTAYGMFWSDYTRIFMPAFRHPFLNFFTAPLPLFGGRLLELGPWPYWCFLLAVFAAVMAAAALMVHATLRAAGTGRGEALAGTALFLSFSYTWLLAACPESFPLACLAGLLTLRWGLSPHSERGTAGKVGWCALTLLNGGITTTNGVKVVLAYLAARGLTRRRLVRLLLGGVALAAAAGTAVLLRYLLFNLTHAETKLHLSAGYVHSLESFTHPDLKEWLRLVWLFFSEPVVTHGDALGVSRLARPYGSVLAPAAVAALYAAAAIGAWRMRRQRLVKMALAMCLVDVALHLALRWGLDEGQVYCGHWLYTPALLAALLPATCTGRLRQLALAGLFALALILFACGAYAFATACTGCVNSRNTLRD